MNVAFFGLPLGGLALLSDGHELGLAVLSPIAAPGRRRLRARVRPECIVDAGSSGAGIEGAVDAHMTETVPELVVSWFWTRRLPERWLRPARYGAIGVHPSLLPRHRGPNPYFWTIDQGDLVTGVTVHELDPSYDTGAILQQRTVEVGMRDAWQLARALDRPSLEALRNVVACIARGEYPTPTPQEEERATWASEPEGLLLRVDWTWPTERVLRRIRALSPVPGLAIELEGQPLFVTRAQKAQRFVQALEPGEASAGASSLAIRTGDGAVEVLRAVAGEGGSLPEGVTLAAPDLALIVLRRRSV